MANQNAILKVVGARSGPRDLRVVAVDTNASAWTFTDLGAAGAWTADEDITFVDIAGQGSTAPAVTAAQLRLNGNDRAFFVNIPAVFATATSRPYDRIGGLLGTKVRQGSTIALISRT